MSSSVIHPGPPVEELSPEIIRYIQNALAEDIGAGDVTTDSIVPAEGKTGAQIVAKQRGVIAGLDIAAKVFGVLDEELSFTPKVAEGTEVEGDTVVAELFWFRADAANRRTHGSEFPGTHVRYCHAHAPVCE